MEKDIYKLKLHETSWTQDYFITRVPGGWLYQSKAGNYIIFVLYVPEGE